MCQRDPGDRSEQFVRLLKRHERRLNAYVVSLVHNWVDAEDILQEVAVDLWRRFDAYDPAATSAPGLARLRTTKSSRTARRKGVSVCTSANRAINCCRQRLRPCRRRPVATRICWASVSTS